MKIGASETSNQRAFAVPALAGVLTLAGCAFSPREESQNTAAPTAVTSSNTEALPRAHYRLDEILTENGSSPRPTAGVVFETAGILSPIGHAKSSIHLDSALARISVRDEKGSFLYALTPATSYAPSGYLLVAANQPLESSVLFREVTVDLMINSAHSSSVDTTTATLLEVRPVPGSIAARAPQSVLEGYLGSSMALRSSLSESQLTDLRGKIDQHCQKLGISPSVVERHHDGAIVFRMHLTDIPGHESLDAHSAAYRTMVSTWQPVIVDLAGILSANINPEILSAKFSWSEDKSRDAIAVFGILRVAPNTLLPPQQSRYLDTASMREMSDPELVVRAVDHFTGAGHTNSPELNENIREGLTIAYERSNDPYLRQIALCYSIFPTPPLWKTMSWAPDAALLIAAKESQVTFEPLPDHAYSIEVLNTLSTLREYLALVPASEELRTLQERAVDYNPSAFISALFRKDIEAGVGTAVQARAHAELGAMVSSIREAISLAQDQSAEGLLRCIDQHIRENYRFTPSPQECLSAGLASHCLDCDMISAIYYEVGQQLHIPIEMMIVAGDGVSHVFPACSSGDGQSILWEGTYSIGTNDLGARPYHNAAEVIELQRSMYGDDFFKAAVIGKRSTQIFIDQYNPARHQSALEK